MSDDHESRAVQRKYALLQADQQNAEARFNSARAGGYDEEMDAALDEWRIAKSNLRDFDTAVREEQGRRQQDQQRNAPRPAREHEELREVPLEKMTAQERFNWYAHEAGIKKTDTEALNEFEKNYVAGEEWAKKTRVRG